MHYLTKKKKTNKQTNKKAILLTCKLREMTLAVSAFSVDIAIKEFFEYFRATFPTESITLKMHILETHVLPQIKSTGFGLGLLSEQGTELLHRRWNVIKFTTRQIVSPPVRVHSTMKKYLTKCMPEIISRVRVPKQRKRKQGKHVLQQKEQ